MSGTATVEAPPADEAESEVSSRSPTATSRVVTVLAVVAAVAPIVVAAVRGLRRGWIPTGDDSFVAVRSWDVFSTNPPLLSTWSSASEYSGRQMNHPGPLQFDLLALPVRLFGHAGGLALGVAATNVVAVVLVAWLVRRRLGWTAAAWAMGACALLNWSFGSELLYDAWNLNASLLPFALFLVAVWCVVAGDWVGAPVMVVSGSFVLQMHLSFSILVPALAVGALVWIVWSCRGERRTLLRWGSITAVTAVVCWAQPLYEELFGAGEGNLTRLVRSLNVDGPPTPTFGQAVRAYGGTVALPPAWLPPSFGSPSFRLDGSGRPTWLAGLALVVLAAALVALGLRAYRRGSRAVASGCATALAVLVLGFVTTLRIPLRLGFVPFYLRFAWPLAIVVWLLLAFAVADEVRARVRLRLPLALPGLALVVALVGCVGAIPTRDNGVSYTWWSVDAVDAIDDNVVAAVSDRGPVLVEMANYHSVGYVGPALLVVLQDAGIPFYVDTAYLGRQVGEHRLAEPGDAEVRLVVVGAPDAEPDEGQELVASWSPLSRDEESELEELTADLRAVVAEHGVPLRAGAEPDLARLNNSDLLDDIADARTNLDEVVDLDTLAALWVGLPQVADIPPLLDDDVFRPEVMDRWSDLLRRRIEQSVSVFLAPA